MSNGLGRGLGSLIPKKTIKNNNDGLQVIDEKSLIKKVKIENIITNSLQPRKKFVDFKIQELADSIKEFGIIQPLLVHKKDNGYELIAGERRFRAAQLLGFAEIPVIIRDVDELEKLEIAIIENLQREDLNPIDLASSYKKLIDEFGLTQEEVAKKMSKSRPAIANTVRMLNLPQEMQQALIDDQITEGHAKYLVGIDNEIKQMNLFRKIVHNKLSVAETSQEIKKTDKIKKVTRVKINFEDQDKEEIFKEFFGSRVIIKRKGRGGQVVIDFYSNEELKELVNKVK
ncbi:ParB/RepB/Spo0J family partition protein [Candidatus Parcubacteria bacterium]|nr:ParB/RepB/Spo0J family partition protein [Candidatus Parcubacteria bacterium]